MKTWLHSKEKSSVEFLMNALLSIMGCHQVDFSVHFSVLWTRLNLQVSEEQSGLLRWCSVGFQGVQDSGQQPAQQPDKAGWIRKFCGRGIFRELWRNRFMVLRGEHLYISEKEVRSADRTPTITPDPLLRGCSSGVTIDIHRHPSTSSSFPAL